MSRELPITRHALGEQIELGTLFDARRGQFFRSWSLWNWEDIERQQKITDAQDIKMTISTTSKELRNNSEMDADGALDVALGFVKLSGSAKYLESCKNTTKEARIDVTCIKKNRVRSIPMETMIQIPHQNLVLKNQDVTHFVCEVSEGATANISFRKNCSNVDESKEISGKISGELKKIVGGNLSASGDYLKETGKQIDEYTVKVDGVVDVPVSSFEDVAAASRTLPGSLKQYNNTLTVQLLPISMINSDENRVVRSLDDKTLQRLMTVLEKASKSLSALEEIQNLGCIQRIATCKKQSENFKNQYEKSFEDFRTKMREVLPKLRSGTTADTAKLMAEIDKATSVMVKQSHVAETFISTKAKENLFLERIFKKMESNGLVNFMTDDENDSINRFLLDFSCEELLQKKHALQSKLKNYSVDNPEKSDSETESDEEQENWFEKDENLKSLQSSISKISELKNNFHQTEVRFGFGVTRKKKNSKIPGQICFTAEFGQTLTLEDLPKIPIFRVIRAENTIKVAWDKVSDKNLNEFEIQWHPKLQESSEEGEMFSQTGVAAQWDMASVDSFQNDFEISMYQGEILKKGQNYDVQIVVKCDTLGSILCQPLKNKAGAIKAEREDSERQLIADNSEPSAITNLFNYFIENEGQLQHVYDRMNIEEDSDGDENTVGDKMYWKIQGCCLYPGMVSEGKNEEMFDLAPDFEEDLEPFPITHFNSSVLVFVGEFETVQRIIDAYVSFLLGATLCDPYRIRTHFDLSNKSEALYRLRPHSKLFLGKTLYFCASHFALRNCLGDAKINAIVFCADEECTADSMKRSSFRDFRKVCKQRNLTNTIVLSYKNIAAKNDALRNLAKEHLEMDDKLIFKITSFEHWWGSKVIDCQSREEIDKWDANMSCLRKLHQIIINAQPINANDFNKDM